MKPARRWRALQREFSRSGSAGPTPGGSQSARRRPRLGRNSISWRAAVHLDDEAAQ